MATLLHPHTDNQRAHHHRSPAIQFGQGILGATCLVVGLMLSATLLLSPVGVPLALIGIAVLVTSGEE